MRQYFSYTVLTALIPTGCHVLFAFGRYWKQPSKIWILEYYHCNGTCNFVELLKNYFSLYLTPQVQKCKETMKFLSEFHLYPMVDCLGVKGNGGLQSARCVVVIYRKAQLMLFSVQPLWKGKSLKRHFCAETNWKVQTLAFKIVLFIFSAHQDFRKNF